MKDSAFLFMLLDAFSLFRLQLPFESQRSLSGSDFDFKESLLPLFERSNPPEISHVVVVLITILTQIN
jgi:hypothetical protein